MKYELNKSGICIVEIIMTVAILGVVIAPLMSLFVASQKINKYSELEYKTILFAQNYMEEMQESKIIDVNKYLYNCETNCFERLINEENDLTTKIIISPLNDIIYNIEISVYQNGKVINTLMGNKIFN